MSKTTELTVRQQYWLEHLQACEESACSAREYADQHGLKVSGLYNARCVLKKKGVWSCADVEEVPPTPSEPAKPAAKPATTFHRVIVKPVAMDEAPACPPTPPGRTATPCRIHLPNGVMLEVMTGTDSVALATVVAAAGAWT